MGCRGDNAANANHNGVIILPGATHGQQDKSLKNQATKTMITTVDEERIRQIIHEEVKQEIIREMQEGDKHDKNQGHQAIREPGIPDQNQEVVFLKLSRRSKKSSRQLKSR
jgi:hypothetical protein